MGRDLPTAFWDIWWCPSTTPTYHGSTVPRDLQGNAVGHLHWWIKGSRAPAWRPTQHHVDFCGAGAVWGFVARGHVVRGLPWTWPPRHTMVRCNQWHSPWRRDLCPTRCLLMDSTSGVYGGYTSVLGLAPCPQHVHREVPVSLWWRDDGADTSCISFPPSLFASDWEIPSGSRQGASRASRQWAGWLHRRCHSDREDPTQTSPTAFRYMVPWVASYHKDRTT